MTAPSASKSELAYRWIKARIAEGEFTAGYRLVLAAIAGQLEMSVVPVREAIRRLEAEGLVQFEPNVGARVTMRDEAGFCESMQALSVLEGAATGLAAALLTSDDLAAARELNDRLRASLVDFDPRSFTRLNREFHALLVSRCPNSRLVELVDVEWTRLSHLRDSTFSFVPGRAPESVREHDDLLDLLERGADPAEVDRAARRHRAATLDAYLDRHQLAPASDAERPDAAEAS